jgi:hypothetical protein
MVADEFFTELSNRLSKTSAFYLRPQATGRGDGELIFHDQAALSAWSR